MVVYYEYWYYFGQVDFMIGGVYCLFDQVVYIVVDLVEYGGFWYVCYVDVFQCMVQCFGDVSCVVDQCVIEIEYDQWIGI